MSVARTRLVVAASKARKLCAVYDVRARAALVDVQSTILSRRDVTKVPIAISRARGSTAPAGLRRMVRRDDDAI